MPFVVDASVTLAWFLDDEKDEFTAALLDRLEFDFSVAPAVWTTEVANGLLMAVRRGRLATSELPTVRAALTGLPIRIQAPNLHVALESVSNLAESHGLSAYDASYLDLAVTMAVPLATRDLRLRRAADAEGVAVLE